MNVYITIIISVLLNASAQLFLKAGMRSAKNLDFGINNLLEVIKFLSTNGYIYLGFFCYFVSVWLWLAVLKKIDVMVAYPFISMGILFTTFFAWLIYNEPLNIYRVIGIITICAGVIILSQG